ncbi:hypothetical protein DPMN_098273 [Dreissena polymorpha]|uniref:Uncharacterized protein n=5 Tax=Dreissena polymorpha TaxID=45954 RepID=A0A9D4R660_DREPO|nr:hypothetical protein DPMN_098273 [Dreissena polymorpha]
MLMEGITYLGMVRKEYCPLPEWSPSNSCALAEVRKCAWKVGKYIALATPYSDACE